MGDTLDLTTLAGRVGYLHAASGLDRKALSRAARLADTHVGMLIRGDVEDPATSTLRKLAATCGVPTAWLLDGSGEVPSPARVRECAAAANARREAEDAARDEADQLAKTGT
jgi:transcriptional regulator with XRE-family HTH domain